MTVHNYIKLYTGKSSIQWNFQWLMKSTQHMHRNSENIDQDQHKSYIRWQMNFLTSYSRILRKYKYNTLYGLFAWLLIPEITNSFTFEQLTMYIHPSWLFPFFFSINVHYLYLSPVVLDYLYFPLCCRVFGVHFQ